MYACGNLGLAAKGKDRAVVIGAGPAVGDRENFRGGAGQRVAAVIGTGPAVRDGEDFRGSNGDCVAAVIGTGPAVGDRKNLRGSHFRPGDREEEDGDQ